MTERPMRPTSGSTFTLFPTDGPWRIAVASAGGEGASVRDVELPAGATPAGAAVAVAAALAGLGYRGQGVALAPPSAWCLSAPVARPASTRQRRRQAMLFRLEERLPLAAEDVAADFVDPPAAAGPDAPSLAVAVPVAVAKPIVDALEAAGVRVELACPAALLAAQAVVGDGADVGPAGRGPDVCVWVDGSRAEWVELADGRPTGWYVLPADSGAIACRLAVAVARWSGGGGTGVGITGGGSAGRRLRLHLVGADAATADAVRRVDGASITTAASPDLAVAAATTAGRALGGRLTPWVNLRQGPLASADPLRRFRRPLAAAAAAVLLCLACLAAALFWRAGQYRALARAYEAGQAEAFGKAFPGQPLGAVPVSRLQSEERRLTAAAGGPVGGGVGGSAAGGGSSASVLPALYAALARLPDDVRFRVGELRLSDGKLTIEGQAKTHADAEAVAAALRADGGFAVELPRSDQVGGGGATGVVSFTLTATAGPGAAFRPGPPPSESDPDGSRRPVVSAGKPSSKSPPGRSPGAAGTGVVAGAARTPPPVAAAVRPASLPPVEPPPPGAVTTQGFGISADAYWADPATRPSTAALLHLGHVAPVTTDWPPKMPPPSAKPSWLATPPAGKRLAAPPAAPKPPADPATPIDPAPPAGSVTPTDPGAEGRP